MNIPKLLLLNLSLFDGAAATGDGAGEGTTGETTAIPGNTRRGNSGEYDNVLFGKQDSKAGTVTNTKDTQRVAGAKENGVQVTSNTLDERRRAFREMVNGEYKDVYTEETQRIIDRRFKETRALESKIQDQQAIIDVLNQRYDIKDGDLKKLSEKIENDNAYWSEAAEEAGMSVEQYKEFMKLQRENAAYRKADQAKAEDAHVRQKMQQWFEEAQAVKARFPDFDFKTELQNKEFLSMLRAGTPVEHAYKVMHFDELMGGAISVTAANIEKRVTDNVRARGNRPAENGTLSQSAFTVKDDPSKLTKNDFKEIEKRVARGEKISF